MTSHTIEPMTRTEFVGKSIILRTQQALDLPQPSAWGHLIMLSCMIPPKSQTYRQPKGIPLHSCHAGIEKFAEALAAGVSPRRPYRHHPMVASINGSEDSGWHIAVAFGIPNDTNVSAEYDIWTITHSSWAALNAHCWVEGISLSAALGMMGRLDLTELRDPNDSPAPALKAEFESHLLLKLRHAEKIIDDDLGGVRNLIEDLGGVEVAELLIDNTRLDKPPAGFTTLIEHNLRHLTIEQAIVDYAASGLFDEDVVKLATARLAMFSRKSK